MKTFQELYRGTTSQPWYRGVELSPSHYVRVKPAKLCTEMCICAQNVESKVSASALMQDDGSIRVVVYKLSPRELDAALVSADNTGDYDLLYEKELDRLEVNLNYTSLLEIQYAIARNSGICVSQPPPNDIDCYM